MKFSFMRDSIPEKPSGIYAIVQQIGKTYHKNGINGVMKKGLAKGWRYLFRTNNAVWYEKIIDSNNEEVHPEIPVTVHCSDFEETLIWIQAQEQPWMLPPKEKDIALKEKHYWVNAQCDKHIIGYVKVGIGHVYINDFEQIIKFPESVAYIYDSFVLPSYRRKKVASYLINETIIFLRKEGFSKILCHIPAWNIASANAYSRLGFEGVKTIRFVKLFGFKIITSNPALL
jgi:ribosomal protein S18 acetylase RimI-like enzyme